MFLVSLILKNIKFVKWYYKFCLGLFIGFFIFVLKYCFNWFKFLFKLICFLIIKVLIFMSY